jgi:hypothetical protein
VTDRSIEPDELDLPTARELAAEQLERDAPDALLRDHYGARRLTDEP